MNKYCENFSLQALGKEVINTHIPCYMQPSMLYATDFNQRDHYVPKALLTEVRPFVSTNGLYQIVFTGKG